MAARNDDGLYAKARSLFISKATMDDLTGRATPRQTDAASRPFDTEPANGERSKRERLLRRARFPVVKSLCVCSIEVRPMQRNYSVRKSGRN